MKNFCDVVLFIDLGYAVIEDSYCYPWYEKVTTLSGGTLSQAKEQCGWQQCAMFDDVADPHDTFNLCHPGAEIEESVRGAVLYIKRQGMQNCATYYFFYLRMVNSLARKSPFLM